jgi:hypothetical protein
VAYRPDGIGALFEMREAGHEPEIFTEGETMNIRGLVSRAAVLAVTAGVFASVVSAHAATMDVPHTSAVRPEALRDLDAAVRVLAPHVSRRADGTFAMNAPAAAVAEVGPDMFASIGTSVGRVNAMITRGELTSDADLGVHLADADALARGGVNKLSFHWWGIEVDLDSYWTNKLVSAINAGAGTAAVAAVLAGAGVISSPGAVPAGVASGILWVGASVIQFCANENGVELYLTYNGVPWCGGQ